jgi:KDO2-lipid IV(A) lauroyltransferase
MLEELRALVGPMDDPEAAVREAYQVRVFDELEVLAYPRMNPGNVGQYTVIEGLEHLDRGLAGGRGVVLMLSHYGANQMVMPALGHRGYAMSQLSAPPTAWIGRREEGRVNPLWKRVQQWRYEHEQALPAAMIDVFGFMRPAYRCLEQNGVLGVAFDGGGGRRWVSVPLGQRTAWVSTQPWQLARSTGAAVVPALVTRRPRQAIHRVVLRRPIRVARTADRAADVAGAARRYAAWFSDHVVGRPAPYLHFLALRRRVRHTDSRTLFDYDIARG